MKVVIAQINPTIGALGENSKRIIHGIERGKSLGADLVLFPELALCGYPPEDFLLLPHFIEAVEKHLQEIVQATRGIAAIVGLPRRNPHSMGKPLCNSAALINGGEIEGFADKILLPTYDVFDERRYFEPGEQVCLWTIKGRKVGVSICEDIWQHSGYLQSAAYARDPVLELTQHQPEMVVNLSASPYSINKSSIRLDVCLKAAKTLECPIILCNQIGGNDSLIFDGNSLYVNQHGLICTAKKFEEEDLLVDLSQQTPLPFVEKKCIRDLYQALLLGLRDYFMKLGFHKACFGLSGGVDSAVVACLAVEALGAENVLALGMPSRYSSSASGRDASQLAQTLGIEYHELSIEPLFESFVHVLAPVFQGKAADTTEENLQARIRGMLLMAHSNKFGYLVLSTGNKSEWAMGYATLYGDMCGGLAVIGDVTKEQVYALAHWINREREVIPENTIQRPPSAELRPNQKDSDSLPDYAIVDQVLQAYVEEHRSPQWIARRFGYPLSLVEELVRRIHWNEYKRRQAAPVLRVSEKAFSVGRRFPIVQKWA